MSTVILCLGKRAEIPYCIPVSGINIYSVEELCYFLGENAFLMDERIVNKHIVEWLEDECALAELAELLYPIVKGEKNVEAFVSTIVEYTGYFIGEEKERVLSAVRDCEGRSVGERKKTRADYYLEKGKYELAVKEYELLLEESGDFVETVFHGDIFYSMAMAYVKMFLFEQADYYFEKAYAILQDEKTAFNMLASKRFYMSEQDYICYIADNPQLYNASQMLEEKLNEAEKLWQVSEKKKQLHDLKNCKSIGESQLYYEEIERITNRLKENYRKCLQE